MIVPRSPLRLACFRSLALLKLRCLLRLLRTIRVLCCVSLTPGRLYKLESLPRGSIFWSRTKKSSQFWDACKIVSVFGSLHMHAKIVSVFGSMHMHAKIVSVFGSLHMGRFRGFMGPH